MGEKQCLTNKKVKKEALKWIEMTEEFFEKGTKRL